jgi:hypothetical protein
LGDCTGGVCQQFQLYTDALAFGWDMALLPASGSNPQRLLVTAWDFIDIPLAGLYPPRVYDYAGTDDTGYGGIAVAGSDYFLGSYTQNAGGVIYRGSADNLAAQTGPTSWLPVAHADTVAADTDYVYWADCDNTNQMIIRAPRSGGANQQVAANLGHCPEQMRMDGTTLWYTAISGDGFYSIDTTQAPSAIPTAWQAGRATRGLALDAQYIYFSTWSSSSGVGYVCRAGKQSLDAANCLGGQQDGPISLALDGSWLYFANEGTAAASYADGAIYRVAADLTGARGDPVVQNVARPRVVVVTSNAIYWMATGTENTAANVFGLAK